MQILQVKANMNRKLSSLTLLIIGLILLALAEYYKQIQQILVHI